MSRNFMMDIKRVNKPWGWELWFAHNRHYVGKIIHITKGRRLSKQYHRYKQETIYSHSGTWQLEIDGQTRRMRPGQAAHIPVRVVHRFCAPYEDVDLIEVSTPQVKDVIRLEDDYGRSPDAHATRSR